MILSCKDIAQSPRFEGRFTLPPDARPDAGPIPVMGYSGLELPEVEVLALSGNLAVGWSGTTARSQPVAWRLP